jgi:hypothetical protein
MRRLAPSHPLSLLLLATALFTFLIQSGELGTSDTTHRLQVTHSLWTGQPQVFPEEYPEFGVHGRGGRLYAWYGIGQPLLMLPADLVGSAASHLQCWNSYVSNETDPSIRNIVVSVSTNILINVVTAFVAFHLLGLLGFSVRESITGTLALICATTHLHYAQNLTENNYILLLTITGFVLQYKWLITGNRRALFWGSAALGLNLLTRLTTALDILGVGCFILFASVFNQRETNHAVTQSGPLKQKASPETLNVIWSYLRLVFPVYGFFFLLDRVYQYLRFDSWTNTYIDVSAREQRVINPALPANFPFSGGWIHGGIDSGVLGPFLAPAKSIFLFDPMFFLTLILVALLWRQLTSAMRAFLIAVFSLLATYILFYARYVWWSGDFAWGDRYISSVVELAALLAVPLLLRYRHFLGRPIWYLSLVITAASVAIQCASLAFWLPLEIYQMDTFGRHTFVVLLRFKNIAAFALNKRDAWALNTPTMFVDPWDAAHITAWNFLPSLVRHIGVTPLWVVHILYGVWVAVALALIFVSAKLIRSLSCSTENTTAKARV